MAYPAKGVPLRDIIKQVKNRDPQATKLNHPGLYYFSKELRGSSKQDGDFDAQIKIGAAGLKEPPKSDDPEFKSRGGQLTLAHNRIPGRLQMYAGHQGVINGRLLGARTLEGKDAFNSARAQKEGTQSSLRKKAGVNRYLEGMESTAKQILADEADKDPFDGLATAQGAYTYKPKKGAEGETEEQELARGHGSAEYFLVDWDQKNAQGETPHQVVRRALNAYQPPQQNEDTEETAPKRPRRETKPSSMHHGHHIERDVTPIETGKDIDVRTNLYSVAEGADGTSKVEPWSEQTVTGPRTRSGLVRDNTHAVQTEKRKLQTLHRQTRAQELAVWRARNQ